MAAFLKWRELSAREVEQATTPEQAGDVYFNAPSGSEEEKAALLKWISLCTTPGQAHEAFNRAPEGSEGKRAAIRKIVELIARREAAQSPS